ncbi:MAG: PDZ domain-containing protein [Candidatus Tenebribacter mawsonii]|nr:PDZ domain-containing protein [Candidatus Tenebribacter mawsonii]
MKKIIVIALISIMLMSIPLFAKSKVRMGIVLGEITGEQYGVQIKKITKESPAEKAGLIAKDILMKIDGDKIYTIDQLKKMLSFLEPEQKITVTYKRDDKTDTCTLVLEERKLPEVSKRTYMGVFLKDLNEKIKKKLKLEKPYGIMISKVVEDSPADEAGLKDEDILLTFAKEKIFTTDQLVKMLKNFKPNDEIALKIIRSKKTKKLKIILGEKEDKVYYSGLNTSSNIFNIPENVLFYQYDLPGHNKWIGVKLDIKTEKTEKEGKKIITKEKKITEVIKGTPAEKAGLQIGDIIVAVESDKNLEIGKALAKKEVGDEIILTIERDGRVQDIVVSIGKREYDKSKKDVQVTIEDGEIKLLINGVEKSISDFEYLRQGLDEIEMIKNIKSDVLDEVHEELEKVKEEMENIDLNIEIFDAEDDL